jgi:hypothetical protein
LPGRARIYAEGFSSDSGGFICTGLDTSNTYLNDLWEYNPSNDNWIQRVSLPSFPRKGVSSFVIDNAAYIATGIDSSNTRTKEVWEYMSLVGIQDIAAIPVSVFPNPSTGLFHLVGISDAAIEIFNSEGKCIHQSKPTGKTSEINLSNHPDGIYFCKLVRKNKADSYVKIIKQ